MKTFPWRTVLAAFYLAAGCVTVGAESSSAGSTEMVAAGDAVLRVAEGNGAFSELTSKSHGLSLNAPDGAAENFRLLLGAPDEPSRLICGRDQVLSSMTRTDDEVRLTWAGPLIDTEGGPHDIGVTMSVRLSTTGAQFQLALDNNSDTPVAEAWYPMLGGILGMNASADSANFILGPPAMAGKKLTRPYGEHVVPYPGMNMPYVNIQTAPNGPSLYIGVHDTVARYKLLRFVELGEGNDSEVLAALCHHPCARGHWEGAPAVFEFHDGDWAGAGKTIYRPWFVDTFGLKTPADDWIRREGFYQMIMVMLPEGNVNYTFKEIPKIARDGLTYGVTSLQIAGWQRGGHDNGYPYYEPDPRLGTWDDLEEAIAKCHRMGVRIYFFANITVVNLDTEWYKNELNQCGWVSANGDDYWIDGWGMGTLASRMAHTVPLMAFSDTSFPAMAEGHLKYFKKLAEIGADGLHIDKMFPGNMNFNPRASMGPDESLHEGAIQLIRRIHDECRAIKPDFAISFECNWDRVLEYGAATWWGGNMGRAKMVFPELVETVGLYQPYDYIGLNNAVLNGFSVMIAPHHFMRSMDYTTWRGLSRYIREVKRIRDALADTVFYGEQVPDAQGLQITGPAGPGVTIRSYRKLDGADRVGIIANNGSQAATLNVHGFAASATARGRVYIPFQDPVNVTFPCEIVAPRECLVFVTDHPEEQS